VTEFVCTLLHTERNKSLKGGANLEAYNSENCQKDGDNNIHGISKFNPAEKTNTHNQKR
jgi:hypothetical protein